MLSGDGTGGRLSIGELAQLSTTPITTLRYYEQRGLIEPPEREGGKRRYRPDVLMRLMVIRFCRVAGLSLDEIAEVVTDASPERQRTREIARQRVAAIDEQIERLGLARDMMAASIVCTCPSVERCDCGAMEPVIQRLQAAAIDLE
ncbi:MAG: MerR family transcriptional regulator [Ilumatobacter sp.]|uniref:MerR family transcriptional regulator n=1 Tax=Ilumatobacter sp. TaxID=1967498 RepID=UPI002625FBED|nr:MerR family transcriptional regulator [Ilumatobacter sp.]MDJ0768996.1 MerR family transcriptional regulator [Ilumatobacter sp.]